MRVKLRDVCSSIYDGDHNAPPKSEHGVPFITISNIDANDGAIDFSNTAFVPEEYYESLKVERRPKCNDVLYSVVGSFGIPSLVRNDSKFVFQRHIAILRPSKAIDPAYLYYVLKDPSFFHWADAVAIGAAQRTVTLGQLRAKEIELPDMETQRQVADVLSAYDELIENNRRQIKLLEEAAQRLYREWFIDLKFPGHETTPIHNGLPEGWKRCHLRDVLEINGGKDYKQLKSGTYPVYGSGGLMCRVDSFLYEGESVLIPRKGTLNNVMYRNEAFWTVDTLFYTRVLLKNGGKYLFHAVRAFDFASMNIGAAVPSMTKTKLDGLVLTIPTELFLERFERAVAPFYQAMTVLQQQIAAAREARDRLLPKLMSGETAGCGR